MEAVLRKVPGFRTGKRWRQVVAALVYFAALVFLVRGWWSITVTVLVVALLVAGAGRNLPLIGAANRVEITAGYFVVGCIGVLLLAVNSATVGPPRVVPNWWLPAHCPRYSRHPRRQQQR
jgi:hypothetical protein